MRKLSLILLLGLIVSLSACKSGEMQAVHPIVLEEHFSLEVPQNLRKRNDLHDFAPLQMADEVNGYFLIAIEESKIQLQQRQLFYKLADYAHFMEQTIATGFDTSHVSQRDTFEINALQFQTIDMHTAIASEDEPLEIYYHLAAIESETQFYQLIGWCRRKKTDEMRSAMQAIEKSFKELLPETQQATQQASAMRPN